MAKKQTIVKNDVKIYAITLKDGSVSVLKLLSGKIEDEIKKLQKHDPKFEGCSFDEIDEKDIPKDRYFRNAWKIKDGKIDVDLDRAREQKMSIIRAKRNEKFDELGFPVRLNDELEKNMVGEETRNELQRLRDLPQNVDLESIKTVDELRDFMPTELK